MKRIFAITLVLITSVNNIFCQNKAIEGRVIDNRFETMSYMTIRINDTVQIGKTDKDGFFHIEIPNAVNKILFMDVGLEATPIELGDKCNYVEVVMLLRATYDFITLKKADKLRLKEFKKLPGLHKEAFKKGLFKTDKACYTQEFIPIVKKNKSK